MQLLEHVASVNMAEEVLIWAGIKLWKAMKLSFSKHANMSFGMFTEE